MDERESIGLVGTVVVGGDQLALGPAYIHVVVYTCMGKMNVVCCFP